MLAELFAMHGAPKLHRSDNWPKFISIAIKDWLTTLDINVMYTENRLSLQIGLCEECLHQTKPLN